MRTPRRRSLQLHVSSLLASVICALAIIACPVRSWSDTGPVLIPTEGQGYQITRSNASRAAPSGYEGRTDTSTLTAVGNTPATAGKRVVARFTLGNQIKICPKADGTAEGEGIFSVSVESTDTKPTGTSRLTIETRAEARYTGQVSDDGVLHDPVKAEIDYTFSQSGSLRDASGAIATPAASNTSQHITISFTVGAGLSAPDFNAFAGGDPTQGHLSEAFSVGTSLVYWAGIYYSTAQTRWQQDGTCVKVIFDPPSSTVKLVPGGKTTVKAQVQTKGGEGAKGQFKETQGRSGGSVTPSAGPTDVGAPMRFTFTAPDKPGRTAGFAVKATSRAGNATGVWAAGLGTDWSGHISLTIENSGDQGENELQTWNNSSVSRVTIDVKDGKGTANGFTEVHDLSRQRQRALRGGSITLINAGSQSVDGSFEDSAPAELTVVFPGNGKYSVRVSYAFKEGTARGKICGRTDCSESNQQLLITATNPGIDGTVENPNHLSGSKSTVQAGTGYRGTGKVTTTLTWDLARQGTTQ